MALKDRLREGAQAEPSFSCTRYEARAGSRRCRHFVPGGACALPDEFMCVEWLRANGHDVPPPLLPLTASPAPLAPEPPGGHEPRAAAETEDVRVFRNLTDADIASFKALGAEVCIRSAEAGDLWLVPEYTGADRAELSIEHAATLAALCSAFPGSTVVAFRRAPEAPAAD